MNPAEQIARFIERHPGEWQPCSECFGGPGPAYQIALTPRLRLVVYAMYSDVIVTYREASYQSLVRLSWPQEGDAADILRRATFCAADALEVYGGTCDTLPPWLADPVRRQLRTRAGELLTLAGSPDSVVSAAETVDEALCKRPVVEVTGVLRALMGIGMSCRWATGADEAADDYVGFVSRRLDAVAGERDGLAAQLAQVQAMQAAQVEHVEAHIGGARMALHDLTRLSRDEQVTALRAADRWLLDALYGKSKPAETP